MSLENIKAVFFDADNTLIDHRECEKQALLAVFQGIRKNIRQYSARWTDACGIVWHKEHVLCQGKKYRNTGLKCYLSN